MKFAIRSIPIAALALLAITALPLRAQDVGAGPKLHLSGAEITLDGRVQTLFDTSDADSVQPSEMRMRRVYVGTTVKVNDYVSGKLQADFAGNRVSLKDAYLKLTLSPGLQFVAGNAYRPFSRLSAATSDIRILPIERGLAIRGVDGMEEQTFVGDLGYSERDIGLQVMGTAPRASGLQYAAGVFKGPVAGQVGPQDSYQYVGRVSVAPLENVSVGAAWSSRDFAQDVANSDRAALRRGNAWEVDLEIGGFEPGFHLLAEFAAGDADPFTSSDFKGGAAWLAYRTRPLGPAVSALEPTVRASTGDLDGGLHTLGGTLLTPGINVYFGGNNRVMLNLDRWDPVGGAPASHSVKAMFQLSY
jgi:hypothetical protein